MNEGRRSNRIPKRIEAILYIMNHSFPIIIRNISETGLCASIQGTVPIGTRCTIIFTRIAPSVSFHGIVARYKHNEIGIKFDKIKEEQRNVLAML